MQYVSHCFHFTMFSWLHSRCSIEECFISSYGQITFFVWIHHICLSIFYFMFIHFLLRLFSNNIIRPECHKTSDRLEILSFWPFSNWAFRNFRDADRRYEIPRLETQEFITHSTTIGQSVMFQQLFVCCKFHKVTQRSPSQLCIERIYILSDELQV